MASIIANLPSPPLLVHERQNCVSVFVRATGEIAANLILCKAGILCYVKLESSQWDDSEDRLALVGLGFAALAIDKLPVVPSTLELIGMLFSAVSNIPQPMVSENGRAIPDHEQVSCQYLRPVKCSQVCTLRAFPDWHIVYLFGWQRHTLSFGIGSF
uniref:Uncharacterized protein n=1 Tax=Salix viminalis TaxID=40686 RepID=A0A6N2N219_SALVM